MKTFQDLQAVRDTDKERMEFVRTVINEHKTGELYKWASIGYDYWRKRNTTILNFKKLLYKATGEAIEDIWGANYKMACGHFNRFVTQEVQFLLGNGIKWKNKAYRDVEYTDENGEIQTEKEMYYPSAEKLGTKQYPIDTQVNKGATAAKWGTASFGFWNKDHIEFFTALEFAPLLDEETGAIRSGVRFWQIDSSKPLRATLYEEDGYTDMMFYTDAEFRPSAEWQIVEQGLAKKNKQPYLIKVTGDSKDRADSTEIMQGENYPFFPIVPLWANKMHQGLIVGMRADFDCYDLIKSGFANNVDEASIFYWTLQNAGGMEDVDLQKFIEQMKTLHATDLPDGVTAQANTLEAPYNSREALLDRLDKDLYRDAMALDVDNIANGAINETQLKAAYEPLNEKTDDFEYCVLEFIDRILELAGIDDEATFERSMISNQAENIQVLLQAGGTLPTDYVAEKIIYALGDGDKAGSIIADMHREELNRYTNETFETEAETEEI